MVTVLSGASQGPYEITVDAVFSGPMMLSTLLDASRYGLSGTAYVRDVEPIPASSVTPSAVRLWVENLDGDAFILTVSELLRDAYGDVLPPDGRTASFSTFQSSARLSNTSGLVRSWHESRAILRDSLRAYLAGTRGVDVFDLSGGLGRLSRWAQILDAYGIMATCLLGTADYAFEDTIPPILVHRSPDSGETGVSLDTDILLSITDSTTSVEATAIAIYVNDRLAFGGGSGWAGGFGGHVSVGHQILDILLYPPAGVLVAGPNTVSVLAYDLAGNLLDTSYTFTVGAPPPSPGGFGEGGFGEGPFGE